MGCLRKSLATGLFGWLMSSAAWASSPFASGGPLAPWSGPLPHVALTSVKASDLSHELKPNSERVVATPPKDHRGEPTETDDRRTYFAATFNPALMKLGKTSGRGELAPLVAHAVFVEISSISLFVDEVSRTVSGTEFDVGYHLFPQGRGAYGFYLGPRYVWGSGEIPEASWSFSGMGGDLGYQWVIANHIVFNLGAGVVRIDGKAELNEELIDDLDDIPGEKADALKTLFTQERSYWIPLVTVGLGLAI